MKTTAIRCANFAVTKFVVACGMWRCLAITFLLLLAGFVLVHPTLAQDDTWSTARAIFQTDGWTFHVATAGDLDGSLVSFWQFNPYKKTGPDASLSDNAQDSLYVARLNGTQWTTPTEVLLGRIASERLALVTDRRGVLHIFSHSDCLWHTEVNLDEVDRAQAWTKPECLADGAYAWPAATRSDDGRLTLIFADRSSTGLHLMTSEDDGVSWSAARLVIQSPGKDIGLAAPALAVTPNGTLHLVWGEVPLPNGYPPSGIKYARSTDHGVTWSEPRVLSGSHQDQAVIVTDHLGRVHVAWNGDASDHGRYYRSSSDGGLSWGPVEEVLRNEGGLQMPPTLAVDGTGTVHALYTDHERMLYSARTENGWSSPQDLIDPPRIQGTPGGGEVDSANLRIVNGNELHAVYSRFDFGQVFHQSRSINAPRKVAAAFVRPTPVSTEVVDQATVVPESTVVSRPTLESTGLPQDSGTGDALPPSSGGMAPPLIFALSPVILLIGLMIVLTLRRKR